jgi:hypothetical protein
VRQQVFWLPLVALTSLQRTLALCQFVSVMLDDEYLTSYVLALPALQSSPVAVQEI